MTRVATNIVSLVQILLEPFNELEAAFSDLLTQRSIDVAVGDQLDILGTVVGQPRVGAAVGNDDIYRRYVRARVAANRSSGTGDDLIGVVQLALADYMPTLNVHVYPGDVNGAGYAMIVVQIEQVYIDDEIAAVLEDLLQASVSAGVRCILRYAVSAWSSAFRFDTPGQGFDQGRLLRGVDVG
jgi:hypothetical protein